MSWIDMEKNGEQITRTLAWVIVSIPVVLFLSTAFYAWEIFLEICGLLFAILCLVAVISLGMVINMAIEYLRGEDSSDEPY